MSATNTYDFYVIKATHKNKTPLKKLSASLGVSIECRFDGWRRYGPYRAYKSYCHEVNLGYVDVAGKTRAQIDAEIEAAAKPARDLGLPVSCSYIARD